jgi:hypothetical protein
MECSVLSFFRAECKVSDTGSAQCWASSLIRDYGISSLLVRGFGVRPPPTPLYYTSTTIFCFVSWSNYYKIEPSWYAFASIFSSDLNSPSVQFLVNMQTTDKFNADEQLRIGWPYTNANWFQIRYDNYNGFKFDLMIRFQSGIRVNMVLWCYHFR